MFYNLLYCDENLLNHYLSIANAGRNIEYTEIESTTTKGANLGIAQAHFGLDNKSTLKGTIKNNTISQLIALENSLENNDYFIDYTVGDEDESLSLLNNRMIFRANLPLEIHEDYDMYETMNTMQDQLLNEKFSNVKKEEEKLFESIFNLDNVTIPVLSEDLSPIIFSKIKNENLYIDKNNLEELEDDNTILAKVKKSHSNKFKLFDPLKDFMSLNRSMRKEMSKNKNNDKLNPIIIDSPGIEVEIIAIYN